MKRILLMGAGHAHIMVLRHFVRHRPQAEVIIINDNEYAWYTGALPALIRGDIKPEHARVDLPKLAARAGARFILASYQGHGEAMEAHRLTVRFTNHQPIDGDILSLSIGGEKTPDGIKPIPEFLQRLDQWDTCHGPKIGIIGSGAAGIEIALALRIRLGETAAIFIQSRHGLLLPSAPPKAQKAAANALQNANIPIVQTLPDGVRIITAFTPEPSLQITETLQLSAYPDHAVIPAKAKIFITGDAAKFPTPLARSGAIAVRQGCTLAYNLTHDQPRHFQPPAATLAILGIDRTTAIAWYGRYCWSGRLPMHLKKMLDGAWIKG